MFGIQYSIFIFTKYYSNADIRKFHFCNRVIDVWNNCCFLTRFSLLALPSVNVCKEVTCTPSILVFLVMANGLMHQKTWKAEIELD